MANARYIVRFDDICPTMNWDVWECVESLLVARQIKPILAVVPNNQDALLNVGLHKTDFWEKVRAWQQQGWTIALHGYSHLYVTDCAGIVGINPRSEFAGVPREAQREKLVAGFSIFKKNGVTPDAWVAPGHSFDAVTVELLVEMGIHVISDGFFLRPVSFMGALWVPQQLWRFRSFPRGAWTVCYHANCFSQLDVERLVVDFDRFLPQIVGLNELLTTTQPVKITALDRMVAWSWKQAVRVKRILKW